MPKRFELSETTKRIVDCLKVNNKGTAIQYRELSKLIGVIIDSRNHNLIYARKILERDHAQVWICIRPKVGVRRLSDAEIVDHIPGFFHNGARKKLNRGDNQADIVQLQELDVEQQVRFSVDSIQRELCLDALSKITRKRVERVARGTSNDLPAFTAVEWAISLMPRKKLEK